MPRAEGMSYRCQDSIDFHVTQDRAQAQAERIKTLREFPDMIAQYKRTEDEMVKLHHDTNETEARIAVTNPQYSVE